MDRTFSGAKERSGKESDGTGSGKKTKGPTNDQAILLK
jgi:hypothetical protein